MSPFYIHTFPHFNKLHSIFLLLLTTSFRQLSMHSDISTFLHFYISTSSHVYISTSPHILHFYISTFLHFYIFTSSHVCVSTCLEFYISTFLHFCISTFLHLHTCTCLQFYISTFVHFYISTCPTCMIHVYTPRYPTPSACATSQLSHTMCVRVHTIHVSGHPPVQSVAWSHSHAATHGLLNSAQRHTIGSKSQQ